MRLGWLTDIHLNFVPPHGRENFYRSLPPDLDALLIGGDIGEADSVVPLLHEMQRARKLPIYFVLGNHDFYRGSIAVVRDAATRLTAESSTLHWLPARGVVPLTSSTALVGHDSWADGRFGHFFRSDVLLNDYFLIAELRTPTRNERFARMNALGDEAAGYLECRVTEALAAARHVVVLTHAPPFREACWHQGRLSDDDWLPHFACKAVGERLRALMACHPDHRMTVLCGHTHSPGVAHILDNLEVRTGQAEYGRPRLQQVLEVE